MREYLGHVPRQYEPSGGALQEQGVQLVSRDELDSPKIARPPDRSIRAHLAWMGFSAPPVNPKIALRQSVLTSDV